jgi:TM2 domain-containing membrane protein YozV
MGTVDDIKQLKELLDLGAITQEEYDAKKQQVLSKPVEISASQEASAEAASGKSKVTAGILGILLGSLGIHKFYLGYTTQGIITLLVSLLGSLTTFGLSAVAMGVIGLIEGIMYLTKSDADFVATYVQGDKGWFYHGGSWQCRFCRAAIAIELAGSIPWVAWEGQELPAPCPFDVRAGRPSLLGRSPGPFRAAHSIQENVMKPYARPSVQRSSADSCSKGARMNRENASSSSAYLSA